MTAVAGDGTEGKRLAHHVLGASVELPHLAPVALHFAPPGVGVLDEHPLHIAGARNVVHQH